ncbi:MAG: bifunctional glutamate N-acetyltransferase/amino-acid acetyltransferase ArgJ [Dichotomicrobium sp.]
MMKPSPFAPSSLPALPPMPGVALAAAEAGIRYKGRKDLLLVRFANGARVGGALTLSRTPSPAVNWCRERLGEGDQARALVVNSGNANAFTGQRGVDAVHLTAQIAAETEGCAAENVYLASTGVIGEALDVSAFADTLRGLAADLRPDAWEDAARAIMTTDTFPKLATRSSEIDGVEVTINGIAKGSGMIAPNMGTMLAFLFTDAPLEAGVLQSLCQDTVAQSFNRITVDGDTSTSDTALLFATGAAAGRGAPEIDDPSDHRLDAFRLALDELTLDLAHQVVQDGEGITKFVTIRVDGANDDADAQRIAFAIANSPLVKTALAGEDPNWGRIVMAAGKAGADLDPDELAIWFGEIPVAESGEVHPDYDEAEAAEYMKRDELLIRVYAGLGGPGAATVWTSDLTHGYIDINADYRS